MIKRFFIKHIFRWITEEDILIFTKEGIIHRGKPLTRDQVYQLAEQAKIIQGMYLWKVLSAEIKYAAFLHWLKTGEDLSSRMLLRADEIIQQRLSQLESLNVEKPLE